MRSTESATHFSRAPALLGETGFVEQFGAVYEHAPWVARRAWKAGIDPHRSDVHSLARAMAAVLTRATAAEQRRLINAHPDLAGKAALQGELTHDSTDEQASAGLDQCTAEEFERFQHLNAAYKAKFDMPFIMAVRGSDRHRILAGFEQRLENDPAIEFERALDEINRIAELRLQALAQAQAESLAESQAELQAGIPTEAQAGDSCKADYPRNLIGYANRPPLAAWPGRARIAVQFVINYEEGGENCVLHGDPAAEAFLSEMVGAKPVIGQRHMSMESLYGYGSRAGFWRLHRLFTERQLPVTVFGVAMALQRNPAAVAAMLEANWEIASHGHRWIDYQFVSETVEREHLQQAIDSHEQATGKRPEGWYLGRTSPNTHRLVAEAGGFAYNADAYDDDLPYWTTLHGGEPQLMVPYTLDANDMRFASPQGFNAGDQFFNYLKDSFDVLYAEGADTPKMMSVGLHCRLVGRPGRAASLARFLDYISGVEKVWITRRIDIANHWREHHPYSK